MRSSKKQAAIPKKSDAQKPGDDIQVAANLFSNYVLTPTPPRTCLCSREEAIHGAGLLVFKDKGQEQVQLRTGFPARVARGNQSSPAGEGESGQRADDKD